MAQEYTVEQLNHGRKVYDFMRWDFWAFGISGLLLIADQHNQIQMSVVRRHADSTNRIGPRAAIFLGTRNPRFARLLHNT
ncbi:hypothetical protein MJN69_29530, partial [Salmonella enterica subsp. enterica serovar Kentucky]|nr:hypothetical protein [Salmonella enterica subsp. enterica serovar Kentucky]